MHFDTSRPGFEDDPSFFLTLSRLYRPHALTLFALSGGERRMGDAPTPAVAASAARLLERLGDGVPLRGPALLAPGLLADVLVIDGAAEGLLALHGGGIDPDRDPDPALLERFFTLADLLARHLRARRVISALTRERLELEKRLDYLLKTIRVESDPERGIEGILARVLGDVTSLLGIEGGAILIERQDEVGRPTPIRVSTRPLDEGLAADLTAAAHRRADRDAPFFLNDPLSIALLLGRPAPFASLILAPVHCGFPAEECPLHHPRAGFRRCPCWRGTLALWSAAPNHPFRDVDREFVRHIVRRVVLQFFQESQRKEQERAKALADQLLLAKTIQTNLLPSSPPAIPGLDFRTWSVVAQTVGGDFYDHHAPREDLLLVALGDISGKGVPAALLHALIQRTLHAEMARPFGIERPRAGEILRRVNEGLHQDLLKVDMFATLVLLRLDLSERRLEFANAGHPFPLLLRAGRVIPFHEAPGLARIVDGPDGVNLIPPDGPVRPGMPIGFLPDTGYTTWGFDLVPGDAALLFTDGMTEVFDDESSPNRRVFGEERLADAFARAANLPAAESLLAIAREIDEWSGGADFRDDQTAILLRIPRPADASAPPPSSPATTPDYTI